MRKDAEAVADDVIEPARRKIELDVPGLLARAGLVEQRARHENRLGRSVARAAGATPACGLRRGGSAAALRAPAPERQARADLAVQDLERAQRLLAARHAQIELRFLLGKDRVGVVLAIVTALAAILLAHGRHHAPAQRPAFGELQSLGKRHCLVVPRRAVVFLGGGADTGHQCGAILRRQRRDAVFA